MSALAFPLRASSASAEPISAPFRLGYRPWLDGVRGLAILLVLLHHLSQFAFQFKPTIVAAGFLGVDVFFVLSGFLITALLLEEWDGTGRIRLPAFYIRRALRLLPALFLFLLLVCAYAALAEPAEVATDTYWTSLYSVLYVTNWINAFQLAPVSKILGHMWSLAIEEQFYLVWPAVLILALKARVSKRVIVSVVIAVMTLVCVHRMRLYGVSVYGPRIYSATDTRADSLLAGCVVAMLTSWRLLPSGAKFRKLLGWCAFASLLVFQIYLQNPLGLLDPTLYAYGFSVVAIAVGVILLQMVISPPRLFSSLLEFPPLVWIGRVSYAIYLWHLPICIVVGTLPIPRWAKALWIIAITLALASASYYFVERPFLRLKKRFSVTPV